jgi:hypothetical protein
VGFHGRRPLGILILCYRATANKAAPVDGHTSTLAPQVDPIVADGRLHVCDGRHTCLWDEKGVHLDLLIAEKFPATVLQMEYTDEVKISFLI